MEQYALLTTDARHKQAKQTASRVSEVVDFVTDGKREAEVNFGSPLMPLVTGMGCALGAVVAAFREISGDSFEAASLATTYFGLCGSLAGQVASHPGLFRTAFIDALHAADFGKI